MKTKYILIRKTWKSLSKKGLDTMKAISSGHPEVALETTDPNEALRYIMESDDGYFEEETPSGITVYGTRRIVIECVEVNEK